MLAIRMDKKTWGEEKGKFGERKVRKKKKKRKKENESRPGKRKGQLYNTLHGGEYRKGNTVKLISSRCGDPWQDPLFVPVRLIEKRNNN